MSEKRGEQNQFKGVEKLEDKKFEYDPRNPETWREGEVIDVGPLEKFNKYRAEIIIKSLKEAVNELAKREGLDQPAPRHLKFIEQGKLATNFLAEQAGKVRYGGEPPDSVIFDSLLDVIDVVFDKRAWQQIIKITDNAFSVDNFLKLLEAKTMAIAKSIRPEEITEYWKQYKDAYILLTGDDRRVKKLNVGGFDVMNNSQQKRKFKFIVIRKEAWQILEREEKEKRASGLINEVLEHEYQEIEHFTNPAETKTPHKLDRDKKFLEVLKVLRKRRYFH